jgi:hypothetical protein
VRKTFPVYFDQMNLDLDVDLKPMAEAISGNNEAELPF